MFWSDIENYFFLRFLNNNYEKYRILCIRFTEDEFLTCVLKGMYQNRFLLLFSVVAVATPCGVASPLSTGFPCVG